MVDADHIRRIYERYLELANKGDAEGIVDLYAEDASIEDPIGAEPHVGREAIRAFYRAAAGSFTLRQTGSVRVSGLEAAMPMFVLIGPEGQQQVLEVVSTMKFGEDGRIRAMRAFWSMDAMRPATPEDLA